MRKNTITKLLAAAIVTAVAVVVHPACVGQRLELNAGAFHPVGTPAPDSKMIELPGGDFSLFSNRIANRRSFPAQGSSSIFSCPSGIMLTPGTATQFRLPASIGKTMAWASKYDVINGKNLGLVQFTPEPGLAFQTLFTTNYALGLYGHQIVGDTLYTGFMDVKSTPYGMAYAAFITPIDINTWHGKIIQIHSPVFMAEACTQGNDGLAYGQFFNSSLTGFNYAKTDYKTLTQDIIGKSAHQMIAMGITSTNRLYGIALDGNLYEVNTSTGAETMIGSTGLVLKKKSGAYYYQSGNIDKATDTFYWAAVDSAGNSAIYTVDLTSGAATKVANVPDNTELVSLMFPRTIAQNAPARVENLACQAISTELKCNITFTAPTKTSGGSNLTGNMKYYVMCMGDTLGTGTCSPGQNVTVPATFATSGSKRIIVNVANAAGTSDDALLTQWIGPDQPNAVTNVVLSIDADGNAKVTWDAPVGTVNGGNLGNVVYNVSRVKKGVEVQVAQGISERTFSEKITDTNMTSYTYTVYAVSDGIQGEGATSNSAVYGNAAEVPFTENFQFDNSFDLFTALDVNKDGDTWTFIKPNRRNKNNGRVTSPYIKAKVGYNDDWLLSPAIHMLPNKVYLVSFETNLTFTGSKNASDLEVKVGTGDDPVSYETTLFKSRITTTNTAKAGNVKHSFEFIASAEGYYRIAFHDYTQLANSTTSSSIVIDDIGVQYMSNTSSPESVQNLTIQPGAQGALNATVSFNVPSKNIDGSTRAQCDSVQVLRDGTLVHTFGAATAGKSLSFADENIAQGNHTWQVIAYADGYPGRRYSKMAYIGLDLPQQLSDVVLSDKGSTVAVSWAPLSNVGANGGYVNTADVDISLTTVDSYGRTGNVVATAKGTDTHATVNENMDEGARQSLYQLFGFAHNATGKTTGIGSTGLIKGVAYSLPYKESFSNLTNEHGFWWRETSKNSDYVWAITKAGIDDGCGMSWACSKADQWGWINLGKVSMQSAKTPMGYAFVNNTVAHNPIKLYFMVGLPNNQVDTVRVVDVGSLATDSWTGIELDLKKYAGQRWIEPIVKAVSTGAVVGNSAGYNYLLLDNINIFDQLDNNMAAQQIQVPDWVSAGKVSKATITVRNLGKNSASNYKVIAYVDNTPVDTVIVADNLDVAMSKQVTVQLPIGIEKKGKVAIKARVLLTGDQAESDDYTADVTVPVHADPVPAPENLVGEAQADKAHLSWAAPNVNGFKTVTDDFDSYTAWTDNFGEWTNINNDNGYWAIMADGHTYPGQNECHGFLIWNSDTTSWWTAGDLTAHSGKQYAAVMLQTDAPYTSVEDAERIEGDKILVTPELSGRKQTISLWVNNMKWNDGSDFSENIIPYYSTTDNKAGSLQQLGSKFTVKGGKWQQLTYEVPDGTKFFAIRWNTENGYVFMLDDMSYESVYGGSLSPVTGYNIYRDGKIVAHTGTVTTWDDANGSDKAHTYKVTAVYADGSESPYSNEVTIVTTSVVDVDANHDGAPYDVYTIDGRALRLNASNLDGLDPGIYLINNKKKVIK